MKATCCRYHFTTVLHTICCLIYENVEQEVIYRPEDELLVSSLTSADDVLAQDDVTEALLTVLFCILTVGFESASDTESSVSVDELISPPSQRAPFFSFLNFLPLP